MLYDFYSCDERRSLKLHKKLWISQSLVQLSSQDQMLRADKLYMHVTFELEYPKGIIIKQLFSNHKHGIC